MRLPLLSGLRRDRVLRPGDFARNCGRPGGRVRGSFLPCADEVGLGGAATFVAAASRRHRTRELNRPGEVDVANGTVVEGEPQLIVADDLDCSGSIGSSG